MFLEGLAFEQSYLEGISESPNGIGEYVIEHGRQRLVAAVDIDDPSERITIDPMLGIGGYSLGQQR